MLESLVAWFLGVTQGLGYWGIAILMMIESSFIPFPSEVVIPPAAWLAHSGYYNLYGVIIAGVLGSLVGALINYFLALWLGRPLIYRLANHKVLKWLGITPEKIARSEEFFKKNGAKSTFIGRLIPVVRQLISLPAGFAKMPLGKFVIFTTLGAGIWVTVLAYLGYFLGANEDLFKRYYTELQWIILGLALAWLLYYLVKKKKARSKKPTV
ncbi:MAG: DedA family protein [Bacilli bacterium]|nr:DedA family protein [Bacilli bacterium]